ncbi:DIP1984 family protein [Citroniella saccharovorans]|uniref:DIP1984 family protein n=1 Tax=Citroniella saccharovorans TaxID=2053367 RepID=A0AAW9MRL5_9FIRM|nr:DIP1984 family protein [Citroniella saccharovorans]MEB3429754.1 DIP1984 family protein [Citroniella saccharovorans]
MKLAEALLIKSKLDEDIYNISQRINGNIFYQEGTKLNEDPNKLLNDLEEAFNKREDLIFRINKTNHETLFDDEISLANAIVKRNSLIKLASYYKSYLDAANSRTDRYSSSEIRQLLALDYDECMNRLNSTSEKARLMDIKIQEINWLTELK